MSVLLETSLGDLVVDLDVKRCPKACENFLKLCKLYKYNYLTFFSVQKDFLAQTGDPTNSGNGGQCIWSLLNEGSPQFTSSRSFRPERNEDLLHNTRGTLSMACRKDAKGELIAGSQFFVTLADKLDFLDGKHTPFGRIVEGDEKGGTLEKINQAFVDKDMRPLRDIRLQHVVVLDDPFEDPIGLNPPERTPSPTPEQLAAIGLDAAAPLDDEQEKPAEERDEDRRKRDTNAAALTLEMVGDLPFAEVRPPENILFVCKLNPVTQSDDLELIFSRFGKILSCEVIRDKRTGDSLQYAFIEFDERESAEQAYFKMQNVLVDDRRIWVDFSQSVSKLSNNWNTSRTQGRQMKVTPGRQPSGSSSRRREENFLDSNHRSSRDYRDANDRPKNRDRYGSSYGRREGDSRSHHDLDRHHVRSRHAEDRRNRSHRDHHRERSPDRRK